jgi:hypothetical protein
MGLSLDEEFLILAGRSLVRKIRPAILDGFYKFIWEWPGTD